MDEMNELQHHGIKGQKWGVRRYQNADGSLTAAGQKRYGSGGGKSSRDSEADAQRKARTKKIIAGVAVGVTLAAATAVYIKNKDAVDDFVKKHGQDVVANVKKKNGEVMSNVKKAKENAKAVKQELEPRKVDLKNRRKLSDADLKGKIERLKAEREFKTLSEEDIAPARKYLTDIAKSAGQKSLTTAGAGAMSYAMKVALTKEANAKDAAGYVAANPNKKK